VPRLGSGTFGANRRILNVETTLNDPGQLLSIFLEGALGRSGRKKARHAARFLRGHRGFVTASGLLAAAGVAWGIYDSLKNSATSATGATAAMGAGATSMGATAAGATAATGASSVPPLPTTLPPEVLRIVRLAVSAARADGELSAPERALILEHARKAGVEAEAERELERPHPLAEIVRGVAEESARHDLYTLAFTIVRADETVTGGERIYLAQLAHQLGIDAPTAARLESAAVAGIEAAGNS
jgi:uncharacterized membrane protein YebE (DUF533 family)